MSAFIPGAERYFRRSLHVKNCRDRLIISSGFQEKGGCPLIRACSVITSNTVYLCTVFMNFLYQAFSFCVMRFELARKLRYIKVAYYLFNFKNEYGC